MGCTVFVAGAAAQQTATPEVVTQALATAMPGDVLTIANGRYENQQLEWTASGSAERPILVRAETPGGVVFSGRSSLAIGGQHLIVEGLWFTDGHAPGKEVISISGSHCTLRSCVIDSYNPPPADAEREEKWVCLRGDHHRVESCTFFNKTSASVTLTVWREDSQPDHHQIVGNHFHTRPQGAGRNGYETIRIGTSETADSDSFTLVEGNRFQACDGEMETVSVKAGATVIRSNTFIECAGTVTLRHGNGSTVQANIIAGKLKKETGGIRIVGSGHQVLDNVIIGTTGRGDAAISLICGEDPAEPEGYQPVRDVVVRGNLLVANQGPAIAFDAYYDTEERPVLPTGVLVDANTLSSDDVETLVRGSDRPGLGLNWQRNQIFLDNQIPRQFTENRPAPLSADDVGAVWFRGRFQ